MSNLVELKRFENDMRASVELQKKLDEAVARIVKEGKAGNDGEIMVACWFDYMCVFFYNHG